MEKRRLSRLLVVLFVPLALAACDNDGAPLPNPFTAPSPFTGTGAFGDPAPFAGASIVPHTIPIARFTRAGCPGAAPFGSSFSVFIDPRGGIDVSLVHLGLEFADTSGLVSAAVFSRTDLSAMFGTTVVPAGGRRFAFSQRFGCELATAPLWLRLRLLLRDRRGRLDEKNLSARLE